MSLLIVVAHPDDEVLGAGGMLAQVADQGLEARVCMLVADADARTGRPRSEELRGDILRASEVLGLGEPILGDFPNIRLNTVAHLDLVQFIEQAVADARATTIFTHHPRDLNDDHRQVSAACQAAARLFQRRADIPRLRALHYMEILSSTEWSSPAAGPAFDPNSFFEIGPEGLDRKLRALAVYRGVMRDYPHPRSREALSGLAAFRGAQSGLRYAEAFQTSFLAMGPSDFPRF